MNNCFYIDNNVLATANSCINSLAIKDFWRNCSFRTSQISFSQIDSYEFIIGSPKKISLDNYEYAISVDNYGVYVLANSNNSLIRGVITLFQLMKMDENGRVKICD